MKKLLCLLSVIVFSFSVVSAEDITFPSLKSGDWESTLTMQGMQIPGMDGTKKSVYCMDEKMQKDYISQSKNVNMPGCDKPAITQKGNKYYADINCNMNGMKMTTNVETTVISDSQMTSTIESHVGPGIVTTMNVKSKFIGPCAEGRKPGDYKFIN